MNISNLGEQLVEAQNIKNNDINSYVWKQARDSEHVQAEKRLVDCTEGELNKFYKHCYSMLYNKDNDNPGRYVLLNIIKRQRMSCNAELFLRWLENTYKHSDSRGSMSRLKFMDSLSSTIDSLVQNGECPTDRSKINITQITSGCPEEFDTLDVNIIMQACLDGLGIFNKKHITLKFITNKLGLWFTPQEIAEFNESAIANGVDKADLARERIRLVKERCGIPSSVGIVVKDNKYLNYKEFRAIIQLRSKKYSTMTEAQLLVLRDKGLYLLENEVHHHIQQWETLISQIEKVAEFKGFTIKK